MDIVKTVSMNATRSHPWDRWVEPAGELAQAVHISGVRVQVLEQLNHYALIRRPDGLSAVVELADLEIMPKAVISWQQPNPEVLDYWEGSAGFWIAAKEHCTLDDIAHNRPGTKRYVLFNGEYELGTYQRLAEAQADAEPMWADGEEEVEL